MTDQRTETPESPENTPVSKPLRSIRSFVVRAGRMTEGQERGLKDNWPAYGLELADGMLNFEQVYGREAPVVLEIGFGMGDSLLEMARQMPEKNFLGIEVHPPGVGRLLGRLNEEKITNVRVYCDDAIEVLAQCIPDQSLSALQLFFPDPWPKKRHNKRRIVQSEFVQSLRTKLVLGGHFHMATDWQPYAEHMMEVMSQAEGYENAAGEGAFSPQPDWRPVTKFQRRGERLGHGVWDLIFNRIA